MPFYERVLLGLGLPINTISTSPNFDGDLFVDEETLKLDGDSIGKSLIKTIFGNTRK